MSADAVTTYLAGVIAAQAADNDNGDAIAPISGARCRCCGVSADRVPPAEVWTVLSGAAFCPNCVGNELLARKRKDG